MALPHKKKRKKKKKNEKKTHKENKKGRRQSTTRNKNLTPDMENIGNTTQNTEITKRQRRWGTI